MPLAPAVQEFEISASGFLSGIDKMLERVDQLAESIDAAVEAAARMGSSFGASAAEAADGLDAVADGSARVVESFEAITESSDAAAEAISASADRIAGQLDLAADGAAALVDRLSTLVDTAEAVTGALTAASGAADDFAASAGRAAIAADAEAGSAERAGTASEGAGALMRTAFLGAAIAAGYGIVKAAEYQSQMTKLLTQAGVAKSQFGSLSSGVLQLAGQVGFGPTSLAQALYHVESSFASVGITSKQALDIVKTAAQGAAIGGSNLVDTQNALDATIVSGVPGISSYSQAMAVLNATVGAGDMTMQDLADAMGTGLMASAKLYGQTITQVGAALATLGDNNIRGAKAGTDLRMAWQAVQAPLTTAGPLLAHIGLQYNTLANTMEHHGLSAAVDQFKAALIASHVPISEWGQYITDILGKRAGPAFGVLLDQSGRLNSKFADLAKGAHDFGSAWSKTEATMAQQWAQLKSGAEALAVSFGTALLPSAIKVVGALTKFGEFLEQHKTIAKFAGGLLALAVAFKVAATAESLLGEAASNPFTLTIVAVAALAFGLYELYTHFKTVRDAVAEVGKFFESEWTAAVHAAGDVITWFTDGPLAWVKDQIALFTGWWAQHSAEIDEIASAVWHDISNVVTEAWRLIWDMGIKPGLVLLDAAWQVAWGIVRDSVTLAWHLIGAEVAAGVHLLLDVVGIALDLLTGHWSQAWSDLRKLVHDAIYGISNIIDTFTSGALKLLVDAGRNIVLGLIHGIESMASGAWDAIKSVGSGLLHSAESVFGIASPSKVFYAMGGMLTQGLANGINATAGQAYAAARTLAANVAAIANAAATGHATVSALPTPKAVTSWATVAGLPTAASIAAAAASKALAAMNAGSYGGGGDGGGTGSGGSDPYTTAAGTAAKAVAAATAAQAAEYAKIGAAITARIGSGITETIPQAQAAALKLTQAIRRELADGQITGAEADELTTKIQEALTSRTEKLVKAMRQIGLEMGAGLLSSLENAATRSQADSAVSKLIGYVKTAWSAGDITLSKASSMTAWLEADNDRLQNLAAKRQALEATIKAADAYANTTTSNTESWAGLSNVTSSMTSGGMTYSGNILSGMQTDLSQINQFSAAIKRLGHLGLSKNLLNQLIQMGPAQGLQVAQALMDGPLSVIRSMNATQNAINSASSGLGQTAADLMYDSGAQVGKGFLSGLQAQQKNITKLMDEIAKSVVETLEKDLKIHSPSLVTTEHGEMIAMGLINGMERGVPGVRGAAHMLAVAANPAAAHGGASGGAGGSFTQTIHVTVNVPEGFVGSPEELARALQPAMQAEFLRYAHRNGKNGLELEFS